MKHCVETDCTTRPNFNYANEKSGLSNLPHVFDKQILGGCSKRRPDNLIEMLTHVIIVEVDENCHINYNTTCEI